MFDNFYLIFSYLFVEFFLITLIVTYTSFVIFAFGTIFIYFLLKFRVINFEEELKDNKNK